MKIKLLSVFIFLGLINNAQTVHFVKASFKTYDNGPAEITADSALKIAEVVLNSVDFQDSLKKLNFKNRKNNCECNPNIVVTNGVVKGQDAYLELFKSVESGYQFNI